VSRRSQAPRGVVPTLERLGRAFTAAAVAAFVAVPLLVVSDSSGTASASVTPQAVASSAVIVKGTGEFAGVEFTVDQTRDLVNQSVTVTWTGAAPSVVTGAGTVLGNYMQIMQCWAEPGTAPTSVPREQCQFGGFVDVPDGAGNIASRQMTQPVKDPNETVYVNAPDDLALKYVHFTAVDKTEETERRSQFFDGSTTNEIPIGRTAQDGTGKAFFEMQTGLEAPGLGCGQTIEGRTPDCFLVVVPRSLTEVDGTVVGTRSDDWLTTSPLSMTNWNNRVVVPLEFQPIGAACSFGRPETPTLGTDFVTEAITAWQPALCGLGERNYGFTSLSDDTTRQQLASDDPGLAFVTASVPSVRDAVYAPVAISGLTLIANVDRQMPVRNPAGRPIGPDQVPADIRGLVGSRIEQVNLTPRLLAKLLTQSYPFDLANGTATNIGTNPFDISRDPEFLEINPDFKPQGYTVLIGTGVGRMLVNAGLSDSADLLWRYVLSDADARAFLAGKPDPNGVKLNEKYKGLVLPTNSFPRADLGCQVPPNAPTGFDLPNCTLDIFPYANGFNATARQVGRGDTNRRDVPKLAEVNTYGLSPNQVPGQRSMLGISDTASAARYRQVKVALKNAAGTFVVADEASMAAAVSMMPPDDQGVLLPNIGALNPKAYPLTVVTYAATVPGKLTASERDDYAKLLTYVAGDGQVQGTAPGQLPEGYVPLPATLAAKAKAAAAAIKNYVAPTPTPTPTPTVEPSQTPVVEPSVPTSTGTDGFGGATEVPSTGGTTPAPTESSAPPTETPSTTPVASPGTTPADPASASRLALLAALILGATALLLRVVLPWVASRRA